MLFSKRTLALVVLSCSCVVLRFVTLTSIWLEVISFLRVDMRRWQVREPDQDDLASGS